MISAPAGRRRSAAARRHASAALRVARLGLGQRGAEKAEHPLLGERSRLEEEGRDLRIAHLDASQRVRQVAGGGMSARQQESIWRSAKGHSVCGLLARERWRTTGALGEGRIRAPAT